MVCVSCECLCGVYPCETMRVSARGLRGESVCWSVHRLSRGGSYETVPHADHGRHRAASGRAKSQSAQTPAAPKAATRAASEAAKTGGPAARQVRDPCAVGCGKVQCRACLIYRTTRTGAVLCDRTSYAWLPSMRRLRPRRLCDAMTIRSQPLSVEVAMIASAGC
jgi:hypothetical protein